MGMFVLSAVVAASLAGGSDTRTLDLSIETIERDRLLYTPAPYPTGRVDDTRREQNGRVWHSRTPVGSRTPIGERTYGHPGAAAYGASPEHADLLLEVRADVDPVLISPWQQITDVDEHALRRYRPWIKENERADAIRDMKRAQHLWLKEQGYIGKVRTHVNANADAAPGVQTKIEPRGVLKLRERTPVPTNVSLPTNDDITRISLPGRTPPAVEVAEETTTTRTSDSPAS